MCGLCGSVSAGSAAAHQCTHSALLRSKPRIGHCRTTTRVWHRPRHQRCVLQRPVGNKQPDKQTSKQRNKQTISEEPNGGSGAAAAGRFAQATRSRHDAACALRVPIGDAAAHLEETQKLDVQGIRVLLRHVRQQRLLGSVAGGRDLFQLQADTALQRWMRCSCTVCSAAVTNSLWGRVRLRLCARPPHRPRPYRQERQRVRA